MLAESWRGRWLNMYVQYRTRRVWLKVWWKGGSRCWKVSLCKEPRSDERLIFWVERGNDDNGGGGDGSGGSISSTRLYIHEKVFFSRVERSGEYLHFIHCYPFNLCHSAFFRFFLIFFTLVNGIIFFYMIIPYPFLFATSR